MEGSKQVLVKVMLFQLREHVHPQDGAMLTFFHEWSSPLLVLSIDVSFVLKFFWKGNKNFENWTSGPKYMEDPVDGTQVGTFRAKLVGWVNLVMVNCVYNPYDVSRGLNE